LDNILAKFGLGQEYGEALIATIKELYGLDNNAPEEYNKPIGPLEESSATNVDFARSEQRSLVTGAPIKYPVVTEEEIVQRVTAEYESGALTPEEVANMSETEFEAHFGVDV
jgi:hypothetical protein